tara:strand:+ start:383 stop:691 length:309 start_codon:yes stop_codon:yes gene_type:complete
MKNILKISKNDLDAIKKLDMKSPYIWLATWFGSGFMRPAPGTWGSLAALPFGMLLLATNSIPFMGISIILITVIGWKASHIFETQSQTHDSKMIVIDEVAGQ